MVEVDDDPVPVGSVVFALIDPLPGHEVAFERWYERDHYYSAGTAAPGVFAASRYVAPRWCKELRRPSDSNGVADPSRGSHLALYFVLTGHDEDRVGWASEQVALAGEQDRLFAEREHLHTWSYSLEWSWISPVGGVAAPLSLDRRFEGASVAMVDLADGVSPDVVHSTLRDDWDTCRDPVAVVLALAPSQEVLPSSWMGEFDPSRRRTFVCFHDGEVDAAWRASRSRFDLVESRRLGSVAWASPFVLNRFGSDRHIDEL